MYAFIRPLWPFSPQLLTDEMLTWLDSKEDVTPEIRELFKPRKVPRLLYLLQRIVARKHFFDFTIEGFLAVTPIRTATSRNHDIIVFPDVKKSEAKVTEKRLRCFYEILRWLGGVLDAISNTLQNRNKIFSHLDLDRHFEIVIVSNFKTSYIKEMYRSIINYFRGIGFPTFDPDKDQNLRLSPCPGYIREDEAFEVKIVEDRDSFIQISFRNFDELVIRELRLPFLSRVLTKREEQLTIKLLDFCVREIRKMVYSLSKETREFVDDVCRDHIRNYLQIIKSKNPQFDSSIDILGKERLIKELFTYSQRSILARLGLQKAKKNQIARPKWSIKKISLFTESLCKNSRPFKKKDPTVF